MSTLLSELLSLVAAQGKSQASAFLQGEAVIAGSPDQEIWEHLARHDILWDGLTVADQDQIRDSYLEAFKQECSRRLTGSDPSSLFSRMEAALRAASHELHHYHLYGQPSKSFTHSEMLTLGLGDLVAELNRLPVTSPLPVSSHSPASSVVPAPLVPEVVKAVVSDLETLQNWRTDAVLGLGEYDQGLMCGVEDRGFQKDGYSAMRYGYDAAIARVEEQIDETITSALTALRNYSPAPSPSVELLREAREQLQEVLTLPNPYTFNEQAIMKRVQEMVTKLNAELA